MEEKTERVHSQRMGTMPEGKLLLSMAVPMMLSMLVQALYNIVDSIYVARVSEDCLFIFFSIMSYLNNHEYVCHRAQRKGEAV